MLKNVLLFKTFKIINTNLSFIGKSWLDKYKIQNVLQLIMIKMSTIIEWQ